jgi:hypothetical protein
MQHTITIAASIASNLLHCLATGLPGCQQGTISEITEVKYLLVQPLDFLHQLSSYQPANPGFLQRILLRKNKRYPRLLTYLLTYSVALVRKRTIPTERPPLVGEVSANFLPGLKCIFQVEGNPTNWGRLGCGGASCADPSNMTSFSEMAVCGRPLAKKLLCRFAVLSAKVRELGPQEQPITSVPLLLLSLPLPYPSLTGNTCHEEIVWCQLRCFSTTFASKIEATYFSETSLPPTSCRILRVSNLGYVRRAIKVNVLSSNRI